MDQRRPNRELEQIITERNSGQVLVERAKRIGGELTSKEMTMSQIRALFGEVRQIEFQWRMDEESALRRLTLLKPKMAYRAQRERSIKPLVDELESALDIVISAADRDNRSQYFTHFVEYFEAILAYYAASKDENARARR